MLTMDIAGAYPPEAGVSSWIRKVRLNRGKNILITDSYKLEKTEGELTLNLITPCEVSGDSPGKLTLKEVRTDTNLPVALIYIHYDADKFTPAFEEIEIQDSRLKRVWSSSFTPLRRRISCSTTARISWSSTRCLRFGYGLYGSIASNDSRSRTISSNTSP